MPLENAIRVYITHGETSEIVERLKQLNICLESFFNTVQVLKEKHKSKIFLKDIFKANEFGSFDTYGNLIDGEKGPKIKIIYSYFNNSNLEDFDFILL